MATDTNEYRIKCNGCGLHYTVLSWDEQWSEGRAGGYCPECGQQGGKMVWGPITRSEFIFQIVPGATTGSVDANGDIIEPPPMTITEVITPAPVGYGKGGR